MKERQQWHLPKENDGWWQAAGRSLGQLEESGEQEGAEARQNEQQIPRSRQEMFTTFLQQRQGSRCGWRGNHKCKRVCPCVCLRVAA